MNIIVLANTSKFPYHTKVAKALETIISSNGPNAQIIDITTKTSLSDLSIQLSALSPETVITLDLAGFEFRTLTGECFLNTLPCKICNIIWGDKTEYKDYLSGKLSLSMLFYDATANDNQLSVKYPYLRYYYPTIRAIPTICSNNNDPLPQTYETLQDVWMHFIREVLP